MKTSLLLPLLSVALLMAWTPLPAQTTQTGDDADTETPAPPGSTVITSDELHSDQNAHTSIFTGNVVAVGTNFRMTCEEMTVYFTNDNKVDKIVSIGNVVINQPGRVTTCGHAEYYHDSDTFVLTDQPLIHDHNNWVTGPKITIERTTQKMTVDGGRSTVTLGPGSMSSPAPAPTTTSN